MFLPVMKGLNCYFSLQQSSLPLWGNTDWSIIIYDCKVCILFMFVGAIMFAITIANVCLYCDERQCTVDLLNVLLIAHKNFKSDIDVQGCSDQIYSKGYLG
jgi:hypothetical protein